jgi:retinol dehydrogenase 13
MYPAIKLFYRTIEHGAQTQIMLCLEPQLEKVSGKFFSNCKQIEEGSRAKNEELNEWFWSRSESMTKLKE